MTKASFFDSMCSPDSDTVTVTGSNVPQALSDLEFPNPE